ncbi:MAG: hypothetical protein ACYDCL_08745 [Myxococcales bacterium]
MARTSVRRGRAAVAVVEAEGGGPTAAARRDGLTPAARHDGLTPAAGHDGLTPVYAAALLKVAMELKRPDARGLDELLAHVLEGLRIDRDEFKAYLARNFSLLTATVKSRAY